MTDDLKTAKPFALSALDGRYREQIAPLAAVLSEESLVLHRIWIELRWLLHLADTRDAAFAALETTGSRSAIQAESDRLEAGLKNLLKNKGLSELSEIFSEVKSLEKQTRHDVKAVEYWLRGRLDASVHPFIHFACTSEDINSTAWGRMLQTALQQVLLPELEDLTQHLIQLATDTADAAMLARTHGQAASPTTFGKEVAVFAARLQSQLGQLQELRPSAKFSGATGNYSAHAIAVPELNWPQVCRAFVESLALEYNGCTTQIEPADRTAEIAHCLMRMGRILTDLSRDFWGYISVGYLAQQQKEGEIGSSTMPHKVNPIDFENAEGNLAMAHALLERLASDLTLSRWQRDLSGSTQMRNIGTALGHFLLACRSLRRGLDRISLNRQQMTADLDDNWEVLTEAVQVLLRLQGSDSAYEQMHRLAAEKRLNAASFAELVQSLPQLSEKQRRRLAALTPETYTGLAAAVARRQVPRG